MRLVRFGEEGREVPGLIDDQGQLRDLSTVVADIDGTALSPDALAAIAAAEHRLPVVSGTPRLGSCVARPTNFLAIGLNYADHAREIGMEFPAEPVLFQKASNSVCGANDPTILPRGADKLDWEVEIAIVIGTRASDVSEANAMQHVAGYCLANDVSERAFQLERGGTWTKGKSAPTFGPLGPWLVTADTGLEPMELWLDLNGERMQTGSTRTLIFGFARIIASVSAYVTLEPGDVILTGTPPGVGQGRTPKRFLKAGDIVTLGARGANGTSFGEQRHETVAAATRPAA